MKRKRGERKREDKKERRIEVENKRMRKERRREGEKERKEMK